MTRYVFSTAETIRYRYPTHVNDLVIDRVEAADHRSVRRGAGTGRSAATPSA